MRSPILFGSLTLAFAAAVACSSSEPSQSAVDDAGTAEGGTVVVPVTDSSTSSAPQGPAGSGLNTGLPCDVQAVLENRCIACHDGTKAVAMLSYGDLTAKSAGDPTKSLAEFSLVRMKDKVAPMPPPPAEPPDADEIAVFEAWVNAGTPREDKACTDPPPDGDGGVTGDAGPLADAGAGGKVCTSGKFWAMANNPSPLMYPGRACNACHQQQGGPNLRVAGTVYTALNESDDCNGKGPPPKLTVRITGSDNRITTLDVNEAGNFLQLSGPRPRPPFRAVVTDGQKTRAMRGSVTSGDCNSCHTQQGRNGAPGRIIAP
jgi:hypothetical protein